jgi:quinol monooxygenase YgiN
MMVLMITIIVHYEVTEGRGGEVSAVLARHAAQSREEPGCAQFVVHQAEDDPDAFVLYEQYLDEAALDAHRETSYFRENITERVVPLLSARQAKRYRVIQPTGR